MLLIQNNVKPLCTMSAASPRQIKKGRRRTFSDDFRLQVKQNNELGTLKKSLSSTLQVPSVAVRPETFSNISTNLTHFGSHYDSSLEDLNRELEKFCPYNESLMSNVANSRYYCDIFSRQSIESGETSSPDDENRVNFQADIPDVAGCEIIVPKRPSAAIPVIASNYQPCTNVQILKSSYSAFRDIAEMKRHLRSMSEEETKTMPSTSKIAEKEKEGDDDNASSQAH